MSQIVMAVSTDGLGAF